MLTADRASEGVTELVVKLEPPLVQPRGAKVREATGADDVQAGKHQDRVAHLH